MNQIVKYQKLRTLRFKSAGEQDKIPYTVHVPHRYNNVVSSFKDLVKLKYHLYSPEKNLRVQCRFVLTEIFEEMLWFQNKVLKRCTF